MIRNGISTARSPFQTTRRATLLNSDEDNENEIYNEDDNDNCNNIGDSDNNKNNNNVYRNTARGDLFYSVLFAKIYPLLCLVSARKWGRFCLSIFSSIPSFEKYNKIKIETHRRGSVNGYTDRRINR